jgi:hypothetical protein
MGGGSLNDKHAALGLRTLFHLKISEIAVCRKKLTELLKQVTHASCIELECRGECRLLHRRHYHRQGTKVSSDGSRNIPATLYCSSCCTNILYGFYKSRVDPFSKNCSSQTPRVPWFCVDHVDAITKITWEVQER